MKRFIFAAVVAVVFVAARGTAVAASPPEEGAGITVLGYGSASAPPDSVLVKLFVSEEPIFRPGGPVLQFVQTADLEDVRDALVELGIESDAIEINPFTRDFVYGPEASAGELIFTYTNVPGLRSLLESLLDEMEDRRGPNVSGVQFDFRVDDCKSLETEAMRAAVADARDRAERLAETFGMTAGKVISISEDVSLSDSDVAVVGCIAKRRTGSPSGIGLFDGRAGGTNSVVKVEIGILVKTTFTLEPSE